jgi:ATP-dependent RNA helicase DDX19/DBP5
VNFDIPLNPIVGYYDPDYENYMHRVGRTGRFGTAGFSLTMFNKYREGID